MIEYILQRISDYSFWILSSWQKYKEERKLGALRSSQWNKVRKEFMKGKVCAITGDKKDLDCHHLLSFHEHPEEELNPKNLIALRRDIHFLFGHWQRWQQTATKEELLKDVALWQERLKK